MTFWDIASAIFRAILFMSLSGSIIAGLLFVIKPLVRNTMSKSAQYYLWVIVIAAYLLPLSVFVTLPVSTPLAPLQQIIETNVKSNEQWREQVAQEVYGESYENLDIVTQVMGVEGELRERNVGDYNRLIINTFIFGMVFFLKAIAGYIVYTDKLRKSRIPARKNELALLPKKSPRLYRTTLAATPMLVGIIRPVIYLPDREYGEGQLEYILSHELTHWRRHDVALKWLATLAAHVHWYNPVAWLAHREINKACELACDEAVIRELDAGAKQNYGDTLINMAADTKIPAIVVSTTMCEEKKKLKERLVAIMNYKKKTKLAVLITAVLAVVITGSAFAFGAQSGNFAFWKSSGYSIDFPHEKASDISAGDVKNLILDAIDKPGESVHISMNNYSFHLNADFTLGDGTIELVVSEQGKDGETLFRLYQIRIFSDVHSMTIFPFDDPLPGNMDYRRCSFETYWNALAYLPVESVQNSLERPDPDFYSFDYRDYNSYVESSSEINHIFYDKNGIINEYRDFPSAVFHYTAMYEKPEGRQEGADGNSYAKLFTGVGNTFLYYYGN